MSEPLVVAPTEAARLLSVSRDFFDQHVKPELRLVRRGRLVLVPVVRARAMGAGKRRPDGRLRRILWSDSKSAPAPLATAGG